MLKAMGKNEGESDALVVGLVCRRVPDLRENAVRTRSSKGGKYLSVPITVHAESKDQLDNIYCKSVLLQPDIAGFSWPVSVQGKARLEANGRSPLRETKRRHGR